MPRLQQRTGGFPYDSQGSFFIAKRALAIFVVENSVTKS